MKARFYKSGIIGQAQVTFGGAVALEAGIIRHNGEEILAIGMSELVHPVKAGEEIGDRTTYSGKDTQVVLAFHNFEELTNFRHILDELEVSMKEKLAKEAESKNQPQDD